MCSVSRVIPQVLEKFCKQPIKNWSIGNYILYLLKYLTFHLLYLFSSKLYLFSILCNSLMFLNSCSKAFFFHIMHYFNPTYPIFAVPFIRIINTVMSANRVGSNFLFL